MGDKENPIPIPNFLVDQIHIQNKKLESHFILQGVCHSNIRNM